MTHQKKAFLTRPSLRLTPHDLFRDAIAGLSVAGLLLPQALAYSSIGNMPPQAGIKALFAGLICYGIFGMSRFAIVSATSSSAILLAAAVGIMAAGDPSLHMVMAAGLVIATGVIFIIAGMAKMGNVTDFVAKPVLRGFTFGLAIVIITKQFAEIVGVHSPGGSLFGLILTLTSHFNEWNQASIVTAAIAIGLLFFLQRYSWLPGGIIVVVVGIIAAKWFHLADYGIQLIGMINLELTAPTIPKISNTEWLKLGQTGLGLAFILYAESFGSIRSFAIKHGDPVMPNRDLFSLGACNLASGILHGMPVGAGYSATAANERFGASSRLSGLVAALMVLPVVWLLMPMIALIPKPVLAAIVIHAVSHTLTIATFRPYFAWRRDHILIVSSVMAVLALGVMNGLLVAVGISLFLLLRQMSAASITQLGRHGRREHDFVNLQTFPKAMPIPGVIILRPDQALFFANADRIMSKLRETISATDPSVHAVVLSLEQTTNLDSVVLEGLRDLAIYTANLDKRLVLARVKDDVYELLQHTIIPTQPNLGISRLSVAHAVSLALEPEWEEKEPELDLSPR